MPEFTGNYMKKDISEPSSYTLLVDFKEMQKTRDPKNPEAVPVSNFA